MTMTVTVYGETHMGLGKQENQDRLLIGRQVCREGVAAGQLVQGIAALSDGVGGNPGGAEAAQFVADHLAGERKVTRTLLEDLNAQLIAAAPPEKKTMAAAAAGLCFGSRGITLFSVGNTRVYALLRGRYLKQLTTDDTTVARLLALGQITPAEAANHPRRSEITACFGCGDLAYFTPHVLDLTDGGYSAFLMTTDGIHDYVDLDTMEDLVAENWEDLTQMCKKLLEAARENGSKDDASILLCSVES